MTSPTTMTLHYWLTVALKDLPEPVQLRLEDEYRAHLLDFNSTDDVWGVLGDPNEVKKQLGSLYVSAYELKDWKKARKIRAFVSYGLIGFVSLPNLQIMWRSGHLDCTHLVGLILPLLLSAIFWIWTSHLALIKRRFLELIWNNNIISLALWLTWLLPIIFEKSLPPSTAYLGEFALYYVIFYPALVAWQFWDARQNYLRLDRTLRLVGTPN